MDETLKAVKEFLRIPLEITEYDDELILNIKACEAELRLAGIKLLKAQPAMYIQCVKYYCKAYFGQGEDRAALCYDKFLKSYAILEGGEAVD